MNGKINKVQKATAAEVKRKKRVKAGAEKLLSFFGEFGERWTKGSFARDSYGEATSPTNKKAVRWCLEGALEKLRMQDHPVRAEMINRVGNISSFNLSGFNDSHRTYKHVRLLLEKIARGK